ncbi:Enhancer of mRNA-decapping protein 3 [Wickerhamomyces ciferrii]|uniref:Enhancer of mRNA-decapping protein 3 n=1 Tax=Wickerhamomyces ciferrii (strain ATCC 14091 / BCRC 22168 / CBS 111 / JCM 3599 / NBRC 0793 / NRRL Y-1031 F-60-10) TaxID=1206466 RepID=K0KRP6_WICCF|nr:Enhancer of mRNA-decapping protein 3 [Wickerhamomyces ciferrii]CCH44702.1 Enhancer of mRNA-decapping protein 3 [Wickerhamomyces ciferrii]
MTKVEGFKVEIELKKDGTVKGVVARVSEKVLTLDNGEYKNLLVGRIIYRIQTDFSFLAEFQDGSRVAHYSLPGADIKDLKVIDIPKELQKKSRKKNNKEKINKSNGNTNYNNNNGFDSVNSTPVQQPALQDDAILFYRSSTPTTADTSYQSKPKKKLLKRRENVYSNNDQDITWDENIAEIKSNDFDFGGSTAGFDKHAALEEFVSRDNIDPSQRLAGHNKLKAPIKTKYNNDENVLGGIQTDNWNHSNDYEDVEVRKTRVEATSDKLNTLINKEINTKPIYTRSPSLEFRGNKLVNSQGETLPLASPIQLLEIERLASESFKITPEIIAENASRGITGLAIKILGGSSRISNKNHNLPPLVLILAGNNRSGARALAAGRQLTNHGVRVIAFTTTDYNSKDDLDENVAHQLELYQLSGGKCASSLSGLKNIISDIDSPIELIIDALQGYDTNLSDLWGEELEGVQHLIHWVKEQDIKTLSLDIPSGIDSGSGLIGDVDKIDSKWVVSLGLPVNGVLHAYSNGAAERGDWTHYLIDIGLPSSLFKKGSLRKFDRNWFSGEWSVSLEITDK